MGKWEGGNVCPERAFRTVHPCVSTRRSGILSSQLFLSREGSGKSRAQKASPGRSSPRGHVWQRDGARSPLLGSTAAPELLQVSQVYFPLDCPLDNTTFWRGPSFWVCLGEQEEKVLIHIWAKGEGTVNMEMTKKSGIFSAAPSHRRSVSRTLLFSNQRGL